MYLKRIQIFVPKITILLSSSKILNVISYITTYLKYIVQIMKNKY